MRWNRRSRTCDRNRWSFCESTTEHSLCSSPMHTQVHQNSGEAAEVQKGCLVLRRQVEEMFKTVAKFCTSVFQWKAFLIWFANADVDTWDFLVVESNMHDLVRGISDYEVCGVTIELADGVLQECGGKWQLLDAKRSTRTTPCSERARAV